MHFDNIENLYSPNSFGRQQQAVTIIRAYSTDTPLFSSVYLGHSK